MGIANPKQFFSHPFKRIDFYWFIFRFFWNRQIKMTLVTTRMRSIKLPLGIPPITKKYTTKYFII